MSDDPRAAKRANATLRRVCLRLLRPRWRRCFWTWPLGHDWPRPSWTSTDPDRVSRCRSCGKPWSLDSFDEHDLLCLVEETLRVDVDEMPELEAALEAWRA